MFNCITSSNHRPERASKQHGKQLTPHRDTVRREGERKERKRSTREKERKRQPALKASRFATKE